MGKIFDFETVLTSIPRLLVYLPMTLEITILSMLLGLLLGLLIAIVKMNKIPVLSQIFAVFVSFVRGTPLIVQLYLSYNGIPLLLKYYNYNNGTDFNINKPLKSRISNLIMMLTSNQLCTHIFKATI